MEDTGNILLLVGAISGLFTGALTALCMFAPLLERIKVYRKNTLEKKIDLSENISFKEDKSLKIDIKRLLNADVNDVTLKRDKLREYHFENYFFWINKVLLSLTVISLIPVGIIAYYIYWLILKTEPSIFYVIISLGICIFVYALHFSIGIYRNLITTKGTFIEPLLGKPKD